MEEALLCWLSSSSQSRTLSQTPELNRPQVLTTTIIHTANLICPSHRVIIREFKPIHKLNSLMVPQPLHDIITRSSRQPAIQNRLNPLAILHIPERIMDIRNNRPVSQRRFSDRLERKIGQRFHVGLLGSCAVVGDRIVSQERTPCFNYVDGCDAVNGSL